MKYKNGSGFIWLIFGIAFAIGVSYFGSEYYKEDNRWVCEKGIWVKKGNPVSPRPSENCVDENSNSGVFSKIGNLVRGEGVSYWSLVYEEPGAPALKVRLSFTAKSVCRIGRSVVPCEDELWKVGDRAEISGKRTSGTVTVSSLSVF